MVAALSSVSMTAHIRLRSINLLLEPNCAEYKNRTDGTYRIEDYKFAVGAKLRKLKIARNGGRRGLLLCRVRNTERDGGRQDFHQSA